MSQLDNFKEFSPDLPPLIDFFGSIDFPLLREQKLVLVTAQMEFLNRTSAVYKLPPREKELDDAMTGIINLLDGLQDAAVEAGIPEADVFGQGFCEVCEAPALPGKTYCEENGYCHEVVDRNP